MFFCLLFGAVGFATQGFSLIFIGGCNTIVIHFKQIDYEVYS